MPCHKISLNLAPVHTEVRQAKESGFPETTELLTWNNLEEATSELHPADASRLHEYRVQPEKK